MSFAELKERIPLDTCPDKDKALNVLSYRGVIDASDEKELRIAGTLFRDWYMDRIPNITSIAEKLRQLKREISEVSEIST